MKRTGQSPGRSRGGAWIGALVLLLLIAPSESPAAERPNIVVVLIDTLRPDYLGLHGAPEDPAPFLNRLSREAVVFDRARSTSSWTPPATASLFTGLYPTQHGVLEGFIVHKGRMEAIRQDGGLEIQLNRLSQERPVLPELLRRAGYRTFALSANINIGPEIGFDRGFDRFVRMDMATAPELHQRLQSWREELAGSLPYFLYLHLNDVHTPYHPREPYYRSRPDELEDSRSRYRSEISFVDGVLESLHRELGLSERGLLVLLSDHGEEFRDHGALEHSPTLFRELTGVLMMMAGPGHGLKPGRIGQHVSLLDVMPTLLEVAGIPAPSGLEGLSLVPLLRRDERQAGLRDRLRDRALLAHRVAVEPEHEIWSVLHGGWKLIEYWDGRRLLFDLEQDAREQQNLIHRRPLEAARLKARLDEFRSRTNGPTEETVTVDMSPDQLESLRALGYMD